MKRSVIFGPRAANDLIELYDYISAQGAPLTAIRYIDRLEQYCRNFDLFAERGARRDDIRPGLRIIGFERRVLIAFTVEDERVVILRLLYGGRDLTAAFDA